MREKRALLKGEPTGDGLKMRSSQNISPLSEEEKARIRALNAAQKRIQRALMSEEERGRQRQLDLERKWQRRAMMTDEELADRRLKQRLYQRKRRAQMTDEERDAWRIRNTNNTRMRRAERRAIRLSLKARGGSRRSLSSFYRSLSSSINSDRLLQPCFSCHRFLNKKVLVGFQRQNFQHAPQGVLDCVVKSFTDATSLQPEFVCLECKASLLHGLVPRLSPMFPFASALIAGNPLADCKKPVTTGEDIVQVFLCFLLCNSS